eukprot:SAG22_NODE_639_length_8255_cov_13.659882_5_plen_96_part_00
MRHACLEALPVASFSLPLMGKGDWATGAAAAGLAAETKWPCRMLWLTPRSQHLGYHMLPSALSKAGYVSYHVGKWCAQVNASATCGKSRVQPLTI